MSAVSPRSPIESKAQRDLKNLYDVSLRALRAADEFIKADLDKTNPQRPWRLLCLNHCILATRTGSGGVAQSTYDKLIKSLPEEAGGFFRMGSEKVRAGQFSLQCRHVMGVPTACVTPWSRPLAPPHRA